MVRIFLFMLLFIWLFRFVMRYVLPALRITSDVRKQMKHMQQRQQGHTPTPQASHKVRKGDYIEYEEIK